MSRPHPCGAFGVVAPVCLMSPALVRLPRRALGRRDWLLATIERQGASCAWAFQLAPDELQFARALAARSTNLWIFRSHQQAACADFVLVDMSSGVLDRRRTFVVEVKLGRPVRRGVGRQFMGVPRAVGELVGKRVIERGAPVRQLLGGRSALLTWLS